MKSTISEFASHAMPVNKDAAMVLKGTPKDDKLWEIKKDIEAGWSKDVNYKNEWNKAKRSVKFNAFK